MHNQELFSLALNMQSPWKIKEVKFEKTGQSRELHIKVGFKRGTKFENKAGQLCAVHDIQAITTARFLFCKL